jgi:hypothetical protein
VRLLAGKRREDDLVGFAPGARAHELVARTIPANRLGEHSPLEGRRRIGKTEQRVHSGAHEELEADENRDRVAGQVEDEVVPPRAEGNRLSRLHRHAPEDLLDPKLALDLTDEVVRPHRGASGGNEHVEPEQRALHRPSLLLPLVRYDAQLRRDSAGEVERGREQNAVRLVNLARPELLAGAAELRSRDENPDSGSLEAANLGEARSGESSDLGGAQASPRVEDRRPGFDVASARPDVRSHLNPLVNEQRAPTVLDDLERHDRVGPLGQRTARGNSHGLTPVERPRRRVAGRDPLRNRKGHGGRRRVGRAQRISVHGGARKRGKVDGRRGLLGEDSSGRAFDGHALGVERLCPFEDEPLRLGDGDQVGHALGVR